VLRSFDGLHYTRDTERSNVTALAARPREGVFQLAGLETLDVDLGYAAYTRESALAGGTADWRLFALHYRDRRSTVATDNRPLAERQADTDDVRVVTLGGHYVAAIPAGEGTADVLLWGALQQGDWERLDHAGRAWAAEAGYRFAAAWTPWVRAGVYDGSGDDDPQDGEHGTFFQVLPTPRIYARFPFYDSMNLLDSFVQLRLAPTKGLALRADLRWLRLSESADLWYAGGGAFDEESFGYTGRPSGGGSGLGSLADLGVDWSLSPATTLSFYLARVCGDAVPAAIYPEDGSHPSATLAYFELNQKF
jgi:hypothetical protein